MPFIMLASEYLTQLIWVKSKEGQDFVMRLSTSFIAASLLAASTLCMARSAVPYEIVTEEWAPYNYTSEGQLKGLSTDIVMAIMALTGDRFPIHVLPSLRAGAVLSRHPRTIMYSLFRTEERNSSYKWVGPIIEESVFPYKRRGASLVIKSVDDLKRLKRITCRHAGVIPAKLQSMGFENLDMAATESIQLYRMLLAGHADVIVGDTELGVRYYLGVLGVKQSQLEKIPIEVFRSSLYIAFSADSDDTTIKAWQKALLQLKASGQLAQIQARYQ